MKSTLLKAQHPNGGSHLRKVTIDEYFESDVICKQSDIVVLSSLIELNNFYLKHFFPNLFYFKRYSAASLKMIHPVEKDCAESTGLTGLCARRIVGPVRRL